MLNQSDQYDIAMGLLISYKQDLDKPILKASGMSKVFELSFNWERFSSFSRSRFMLVCIYSIVKNNATTINELIGILNSYSDWKPEYENFINSITYYEFMMENDFNEFKKRPNIQDSLDEIMQGFIQGQYRFYSVYFLIQHFKKQDYFKKHRLYKLYYKKMKFLMKFFTFDKNVIDKFINSLNKL